MKILLLVACLIGLSYGMINREHDMMRGMDTRVNAFGLASKMREDSDAVTVEDIVDSHGKVLNQVVRLNHLNIQLDMPADDKVCLAKGAADQHVCFVEEPVTSAIPLEVRERCEGRDVHQLNPTECDDERGNSARGTYDLEEDIQGLLNRMKRACVAREVPTKVCVRRYRCGFLWASTCHVYETRMVSTTMCD